MKLYNIDDFGKFLDYIQSECSGEVYLVSDAGDKLSLKSFLSRYVVFPELVKNGKLDQLEIQTVNDHDTAAIMKYMLNARSENCIDQEN